MSRLDEDDELLQTASKAKINLQSSDSDITIECTCGHEMWVVGEYSRFVKCRCGRAYALGTFINVLELDDEEIDIVDRTSFWAEPLNQ